MTCFCGYVFSLYVCLYIYIFTPYCTPFLCCHGASLQSPFAYEHKWLIKLCECDHTSLGCSHGFATHQCQQNKRLLPRVGIDTIRIVYFRTHGHKVVLGSVGHCGIWVNPPCLVQNLDHNFRKKNEILVSKLDLLLKPICCCKAKGVVDKVLLIGQ